MTPQKRLDFLEQWAKDCIQIGISWDTSINAARKLGLPTDPRDFDRSATTNLQIQIQGWALVSQYEKRRP